MRRPRPANAGRPSAREVHPEWQDLAIGNNRTNGNMIPSALGKLIDDPPPRARHRQPPVSWLRSQCPRLLTPPHRQRDRQFVAARLLATSKIGNSQGQPLDA